MARYGYKKKKEEEEKKKKQQTVSARAMRNDKARQANAGKVVKSSKPSSEKTNKQTTVKKSANRSSRTMGNNKGLFANSRLFNRKKNDDKIKSTTSKNRGSAISNNKKGNENKIATSTVARRAGLTQNDYKKLEKKTENRKKVIGGTLQQIVGSHAKSVGLLAGYDKKTSGRSMGKYGNPEDNVVNSEKRAKKISDWGTKQIEKGNKKYNKATKDMSKAGKFGADVANAAIGLASDAVAGPLAPVSMFSRSFGSAANTAQREGATDEQAAMYGLASGTLEMATERLGNVAKPLQKLYGKGVADDLAERVAKKMASKATKQSGKDLAYHGGKTAAAFVSEALEEMVAEGLDPVIANTIYANETGTQHSTSLKEMARAGLVGGVLGGVLGAGGQVVEYGQGAQVRDIYGEDGVKQLAKVAKESDDDADAFTAEALDKMINEGGGIAAGQALQLKRAVDKQNAKDRTIIEDINAATDKVMKDKGLVNFIRKVDENGTLDLTDSAREMYEGTKQRATEVADMISPEDGQNQLKDVTVDEITSEVASIVTGAVMDIDTVNMFTTGNTLARQIYEQTTGETLPATNRETRAYLYEKIARNRQMSLEAETALQMDRMKGDVIQKVAGTYAKNGQALFSDVMEGVDVRNMRQLNDSIVAFEDYYEAGRSGLTLQEMADLKNPVYDMLPPEIKTSAWNAGVQDKNAALGAVEERVLQLGQSLGKNQPQAKSVAPRGKVIHEFQDAENAMRFTASQNTFYQKMAETFNINIHITDNPDYNGNYQNGEVWMSVDADRDLSYVFAHEITHHLQQYAPQEYEDYKELVRSAWGVEELNAAIRAKIAHYAQHNVNLSREDAFDEIVADATYEMVQDPAFVNKLCNEDRTLAKQILDALRNMIKKIRAMLAGEKKFTPAQNEGLLSQLDILKEAEKLWEIGLKKAVENRDAVGMVETSRETQYQFAGYAEDGRGIYVSDYKKGVSKDEKAKDILDLIVNLWSKKPIELVVKEPGKEDRVIEAKFDPYYEEGVNSDAGKIAGGNVSGTAGERRVNLNIGRDYYQILSEAEYTGTNAEDMQHDASDTHKEGQIWHYFLNQIYYKENTNGELEPYTVFVNVRENKDGSFVYGFETYKDENVEKAAKRKRITLTQGLAWTDDSANSSNSSTDIISETSENSNKKFSLKDSEGRNLTPGQADYFAQSKVRDENGDLLVVYHGTPAGEFYTFDKSKGSVEGDFGSGFYFSNNESDMERNYEGGGPDFENKVQREADLMESIEDIDHDEAERIVRERLYVAPNRFEVYLNIKNPAIVGETLLLTPEDFDPGYDIDDFDNEDEYYEQVDQDMQDALDELVLDIERNVDIDLGGEEIGGVLYEAFAEGGISIEALKYKMSEIYLTDSEGDFASNEVVRQIIESLGYDGIIDPTVSRKWKNMGLTPDTKHFIVFKPEQIKYVSNESPTENEDIRYSLKDNKGKELSPGQQEYFKHVSPKLKDEEGNLKRYHHGTSRGDRVGTIFDPERATSGPMPFFTDDIEIATNYSRDKRDTSMAYDSDYYSYETQFRVEIDGEDMSLIEAWHYLPGDARARIKDRAEHTHYDWDDYETLVYDEDTVDAGGGFQWQIKEARGNIFRALCEQWLNSGNLFNNESAYMDVLEFIGVNEEFEKLGYNKPYFKDPDYREEKVYEVYLNITNPFDTADVDEEFLADATDYIENTDLSMYDVETADADPWDKHNVDPYEWLEKLERDIEEGTTYAWTSIPDVVTDFLKDYLEADGIVDSGGKRGGQGHQVVIPFYSEQIKNIDNENPTENPDIRYSFKDDINVSVDDVNEYVNAHPEEFAEVMQYFYSEQQAHHTRQKTMQELQSQLEKMKVDKKLTHGKVLDPKSIEEDANSLVRMMLSYKEENTKLTDHKLVKTIQANAKDIFTYLKDGDQESAIMTAYHAAEELVHNLNMANDEMYHTYKELRDYLRNTRVYIPNEYLGDFPDLAEFRTRQMGRIRLVNEESGGKSVDTMYEELLEMFPGMFDETLDNPADQMYEIRDVREQLDPYEIVLSHEETEQLIKEAAHDILELAVNGKPWKSWADRNKEVYDEKIRALKQKHQEAVRDVRLKEKERAENRERKLKERYKDRQQKQKDNRVVREYVAKMENQISWLSERLLKPTDDKHLPEGYQKAIAQLLYSIDTQSARSKKLEEKYGLSKKRLKFLELKDQYEKITAQADADIMIDEDIKDDLSNLAELLEDQPISEASPAQLEQIYKVLRNITHGIRMVNQAFDENNKATIAEMAEATINDAQQKKKHVDRTGMIGGLDSMLNESMVTPRDFFERIGGGMEEAYMGIRKGFDRHVDNITTARTFFEAMFKKYYNKKKPGSALEKWRDNSTNETFQLEQGGEITLNVAQRMSLYCLMKREQAQSHILGSGIVATEVDINSKIRRVVGAKIKIKASTAKITWFDIDKILETLTPEQIEMANELQNFLNNECAAWGNEVSMRMYGYNKFTEDNYFPIQSADVYLDSKFDGRTSVERIRNFGFTKGTVVNANNPIVIDDIFTVVSDHINKMSMYSGFAAPIADFTRVYNYKVREEDGTISASTKAALQETYGKKVGSYITKFMADLQSNTQTRTEGFTRLVNKTLANYKKATIAGNLRVALQQPTAICRAFMLINPKYFTSLNAKKNMQRMKDHCQVARWKAWGHNQVDMARDIDDIMMNNEWNKLDLFTMQIYGALDTATWSYIWGAVEKEVQAKHPDVKVDSDEYFELCNDRASEIFDKTQVVDSVLHRSEVMRNQDTMSKMITSFMAEPTRTYNMVRGQYAKALDQWRDGDKGKATATAAKTTYIFLLNAMLCAMAAAVADALRGKDLDNDDEPEEWIDHVLNNFVGNANPMMMIPVLSETISYWQGWGSQNMALEGIESLITSFKAIVDKATGKKDDKTWGELIRKGAESAGLVFGVPVKNVLRELETFGKLIGYEASAATEKTEEDSVPLLEKLDKLDLMSVKDGSFIDNILNKFGWNLTEAEKAERDRQAKIKEYESKLDGLTGADRQEKMWSIVMKGYATDLKTGNVASIEERRKILEAMGGDLDYFDKKVKEETVTAYKKTIGTDAAASAVLKEFLMSKYGYTEGKISTEIIAKSDLAKELQLALCANDEDAAVETLSILIDEGITKADFYSLYENRYKAIEIGDLTTGEFKAPVSGTVTSDFGPRTAPTAGASTYHEGIDIAAPAGTVVGAADGGKVSSCGYNKTEGYYVKINHGNGRYTVYKHLEGFCVSKGQAVGPEQEIGRVGSTGISTGPHLHFAVIDNGRYMDPAMYLN